jgi:zinc/manganese transport system substrate-binding protein
MPTRLVRSLAAVAVLAALVAACGPAGVASVPPGVIRAVAAENEYANVLSQIGGRYVQVTALLDDPNTDPHAFETSPGVAEDVALAQLVVQNGVGYDNFMGRIESASPSATRRVIVAQHVLGLPTDTPNPHLWYDPRTMPAVARVMAADLSAIQPAHAGYFTANLSTFTSSLAPLDAAIAAFRAHHAGTPVATTEPVADYLLTAMGMNDLTPFGFQADIMNGVDPTPQDITLEDGLFTAHRVKVFCYNQQVVDSLTTSFRRTATAAGVPVVGVYETMPTPGYDYQSWMLAEVRAITAAVTSGVSTERL